MLMALPPLLATVTTMVPVMVPSLLQEVAGTTDTACRSLMVMVPVLVLSPLLLSQTRLVGSSVPLKLMVVGAQSTTQLLNVTVCWVPLFRGNVPPMAVKF